MQFYSSELDVFVLRTARVGSIMYSSLFLIVAKKLILPLEKSHVHMALLSIKQQTLSYRLDAYQSISDSIWRNHIFPLGGQKDRQCKFNQSVVATMKLVL